MNSERRCTVEGDACALPFPDASFDRALAVEGIDHVTVDGIDGIVLSGGSTFGLDAAGGVGNNGPLNIFVATGENVLKSFDGGGNGDGFVGLDLRNGGDFGKIQIAGRKVIN